MIFINPVSEHNMPAEVKEHIEGRQKINAEYGVAEKLLDVTRADYGTPDGQCDSSCWKVFWHDPVSGGIHIRSFFYNSDELKVDDVTLGQHEVDLLAECVKKQEKKQEVA